MADYYAEFRFLYSSGVVGGYHTLDGNVDDPQDLCLCMDSTDWIFCHETGMQIKEETV